MLTITLPLDPIGKGRPRVTRSGHAYTPERTAKWEREAAAYMARYNPVTGPCAVSIAAYFKNPKTNKTRHHMQKPDADNVAKIVLDAMVMACVLLDDAQVVRLSVEKRWAAAGSVMITIEEIE